MSRPVHRIPAKVLSLLHEREMTCAKLGRLACLSERHVIRVLAGHPLANDRSKSKLIPWLTVKEMIELGDPWLRQWVEFYASFHTKQDKEKAIA